MNVEKTRNATFLKVPIKLQDNKLKLDNFPITYKIIEILENGDVAHIQVLKINNLNVKTNMIYIKYPNGTNENYQIDAMKTISGTLELLNGDKYLLNEIL